MTTNQAESSQIVLCGHFQIQADLMVFGGLEGSKHVKLHLKWIAWIHKGMVLMCFTGHSPLGPCMTPNRAEKSQIVLCGHCQIQADLGVFGGLEGSRHLELHLKWTA
jgi:hypothetical protein